MSMPRRVTVDGGDALPRGGPVGGQPAPLIREEIMTTKRKKMPPYYEPTYQGRPLEYVRDEGGEGWLCDKGKGLSQWSDLRAAGCWSCDEVAFPIGH